MQKSTEYTRLLGETYLKLPLRPTCGVRKWFKLEYIWKVTSSCIGQFSGRDCAGYCYFCLSRTKIEFYQGIFFVGFFIIIKHIQDIIHKTQVSFFPSLLICPGVEKDLKLNNYYKITFNSLFHILDVSYH